MDLYQEYVALGQHLRKKQQQPLKELQRPQELPHERELHQKQLRILM